ENLRPRGRTTTPDRSARQPGFATNTVDYAVCSKDEVWPCWTRSRTHARDVPIQQGTYHARGRIAATACAVCVHPDRRRTTGAPSLKAVSRSLGPRLDAVLSHH